MKLTKCLTQCSLIVFLFLIILPNTCPAGEEITLRTIMPEQKPNISFDYYYATTDATSRLWYEGSLGPGNEPRQYRIPQSDAGDGNYWRLFDPWLSVKVRVNPGDIVKVTFTGCWKGNTYCGPEVSNGCEASDYLVRDWEGLNDGRATWLGSNNIHLGNGDYTGWQQFHSVSFWRAEEKAMAGDDGGTLEFRLAYYNRDFQWPASEKWTEINPTDGRRFLWGGADGANQKRRDGVWAEVVGFAGTNRLGAPLWETSSYYWGKDWLHGPGLHILEDKTGEPGGGALHTLKRFPQDYTGNKPHFRRQFNSKLGFFADDYTDYVIFYDQNYGRDNIPQIVLGISRIATAEIITRIDEEFVPPNRLK